VKTPRVNVCVFTGSRQGARPEYAAAARQIGRELAARGYGLVYGGGNVGLMGIVADAVLEQQGHVIGVIPAAFVEKEVAHRGLSELRIVQSMHERKAMMAEASHAFIAMPGGIGTMEEFFEVLSWAQLGLHNKPCGLLNICAYYRRLVEFMDCAVEQDFLKPKHRELLVVESEPGELLDRFDQLLVTRAPKRFDPSQT
jgi:uncharacterized protein (TIGR00730 family)